jgi:hypothetical protein
MEKYLRNYTLSAIEFLHELAFDAEEVNHVFPWHGSGPYGIDPPTFSLAVRALLCIGQFPACIAFPRGRCTAIGAALGLFILPGYVPTCPAGIADFVDGALLENDELVSWC